MDLGDRTNLNGWCKGDGRGCATANHNDWCKYGCPSSQSLNLDGSSEVRVNCNNSVWKYTNNEVFVNYTACVNLTAVAGYTTAPDTLAAGATPTNITYTFTPSSGNELEPGDTFTITHTTQRYAADAPVNCTYLQRHVLQLLYICVHGTYILYVCTAGLLMQLIFDAPL